jgi:hypothetical protein
MMNLVEAVAQNPLEPMSVLHSLDKKSRTTTARRRSSVQSAAATKNQSKADADNGDYETKLLERTLETITG